MKMIELYPISVTRKGKTMGRGTLALSSCIESPDLKFFRRSLFNEHERVVPPCIRDQESGGLSPGEPVWGPV